MGVDLQLLPVEASLGGARGYSHSILSLDRRRELWDAINEGVTTWPKPTWKLSSFLGTQDNGEHGYGDTDETPYGEQIEYCFAANLAEVIDTFNEREASEFNMPPPSQNCAAAAYLKCLPPKTEVGLYWN